MTFKWSFLVIIVSSLSIVSITLVRAMDSASGSGTNDSSYIIPRNPFRNYTIAYRCFRELTNHFCLSNNERPSAEDCAKGGALFWSDRLKTLPSSYIYFEKFYNHITSDPFDFPNEYCAGKEDRCKMELSVYQSFVIPTGESENIEDVKKHRLESRKAIIRFMFYKQRLEDIDAEESEINSIEGVYIIRYKSTYMLYVSKFVSCTDIDSPEVFCEKYEREIPNRQR